MNTLLFGATGMVGDGVLRWLIAAPGVNSTAIDLSARDRA